MSEEWIEKGSSTLLVGLAVRACPLATFVTVLLFINPGQHGWLVAEIFENIMSAFEEIHVLVARAITFTGLGDP